MDTFSTKWYTQQACDLENLKVETGLGQRDCRPGLLLFTRLSPESSTNLGALPGLPSNVQRASPVPFAFPYSHLWWPVLIWSHPEETILSNSSSLAKFTQYNPTSRVKFQRPIHAQSKTYDMMGLKDNSYSKLQCNYGQGPSIRNSLNSGMERVTAGCKLLNFNE